MRGKIYVRVAESGSSQAAFVVEATGRPNHRPLIHSNGDPRPTVFFALDLDVPAARFAEAERVVGELVLADEAPAPIKVVESAS